MFGLINFDIVALTWESLDLKLAPEYNLDIILFCCPDQFNYETLSVKEAYINIVQIAISFVSLLEKGLQ